MLLVEQHNDLSPPHSMLTSALFLATTSLHVLYALPTPVCCRFLGSTQPLFLMVSVLLPPQYGTHSLLAFVLVRHHVPYIVILKPTVSTRPSIPPSGSCKCTLKDLTYLLLACRKSFLQSWKFNFGSPGLIQSNCTKNCVLNKTTNCLVVVAAALDSQLNSSLLKTVAVAAWQMLY